jgi:oligoribonuclease NrnB/cAMP/cGMP phosphodiesterase (DHH superfamily)
MKYVFYHADCADGFGAAFCAWQALQNSAEYIPVKYGQIRTLSDVINLPNVTPTEDSEFYILDFSFPKNVMEELFKGAKRVVWLDHHKTAFEMYDLPVGQFEEVIGNRHVELDNDRSGALITWDYFNPNTYPPEIIRMIDDRDRWQFKLDWTKEFGEAIWAHSPWSFEQWQTLYEDQLALSSVIRDGEVLLKAKQTRVNSKIQYTRRCDVSAGMVGDLLKLPNDVNLTGLVVNTDQDISEIGHQLALKSGTYGLVWYLGSDNKVKCSFRSNGDYDVSAIAKAFGGGGHKNAAGANVELSTLIGWLK